MKKFLVSLLVFSLLFQASFILAQTASSTDLSTLIAQLKKQIEALQAQVNELQSQLATAKEEIKEVKEEIKFNKTLAFGAKGEEVKELQEFLKSQGTEIYPEGLVTGYFGFLTQAAVRRWQEKYGIESVGIVGPRTLEKLNEAVRATPATPATPAIPTEQPAIPAVPATPPLFALPEPTQPPLPTPLSSPPPTQTVSPPDTPVISPPPPPLPPATTTTIEPVCSQDTWSCGDWSSCSSSGTQTRSCTKTFDCPSADTPSSATSQSCTPLTPIAAVTSTCVDSDGLNPNVSGRVKTGGGTVAQDLCSCQGLNCNTYLDESFCTPEGKQDYQRFECPYGTTNNLHCFCLPEPPSSDSPPIADIKADNSDQPITIPYNANTFISWHSQNATSCSVSPAGWTNLTAIQVTAKLTSSTIYTLTCTNSHGSATDSVQVNVSTSSSFNLPNSALSQIASILSAIGAIFNELLKILK